MVEVILWKIQKRKERIYKRFIRWWSHYNRFLEVLPDGFGFIRNANYLSDPHDVYVSQSQIYKFKLKTGDFITGVVREPKASEKFRSLLHIQKINHYDLETAMKRKSFESLTPIFQMKN